MKRSRILDRFGVIRVSSLIGRSAELESLHSKIDEIIKGKGSTVLIEGEAGIGKSRLISELRDYAENKGARMLMGRGLEGASPYMPFISALQDVGPDLISPGEISTVEEVFLLNDKGLLIAHTARTLRPDGDEGAFGRVFATIKDFMSRSFDSASGEGTLDEIQLGNFKILFESEAPFFLAVVVSGGSSEDLKTEMRSFIKDLSNEFGDTLRAWTPGKNVPKLLKSELSKFSSMEFRSEKRLEGIDPKKEQDRMFDSVLSLLLAISRIRPVILVIDDMQWLDDSSLDLLHYIARNIKGSRVLLLGAFRPEEGIDPDTREPLRLTRTLRRMNRERLYSTVALKRLSKDETYRMLDSIFAKNDFGEDFHAKMHKETEGNPFFVEEIAETLTVDGIIFEGSDGIWHVSKDPGFTLPSTIRDVVLRRMDRLDEDHKKILENAAVVGPQFNIDVLRKVMDADEEDLLTALDELEGLKFVKEEPDGEAYYFEHVVIQEVIYENMGRNHRRMIHRRIAKILENLFDVEPDSVVYDLARHYARTKDHLRAFYYSVRAAKRAAKLFALREARLYYSHALENLEKVEVLENKEAMVVGILNDRALVAFNIGKWEEALESTARILEFAPAKGLYSGMAQAYRLRGMIGETKGDWAEAILDLEAAVEISEKIKDDKGKLEGYNLLGILHWRTGKYDKSMEYLDYTIKGAIRTNDKDIQASALVTKGNVFNVKGEFAEAIKFYERGLEIAKVGRNAHTIMRAYNNLGDLFMDTGELDRADDFFNMCKDAAERYGDRSMIGYSYSNLGECALKRKDLKKARSYCTRALDIFTKMDDKPMIAATYVDFGVLHKLEGSPGEAKVCFDIAIDSLEGLGHLHMLARAHKELGTMFKEKGELQKAIIHFEKAVSIYTRSKATIPAKVVEGELLKLKRGEDPYRSALVGRADVLTRLKGLLEIGTGIARTAEDEDMAGIFSLLDGEQGMGKSRVMTQVLAHSRSKGVTTIFGKCERNEMLNPYYPFIQALTELFRGRDQESRQRFMRKVPIEVLAVLPGIESIGRTKNDAKGNKGWFGHQGNDTLMEESGPMDLVTMKARMFEILSRLLLDPDEPVALFIEDLHFADVSSLQLLEYLAKELKGSKIYILGSYSPDALTSKNDFAEVLQSLEREETVRTISLQPLGKDPVTEIVRRFLGVKTVPDEFANKFFLKTKGNPMFVEELLKALPKDRDMSDLARIDLDKLHISTNVNDLIGERLGTFSEGQRELLDYAAVAGFRFEKDVLFEAMGLGKELSSTEEAGALLEGLIKKRILKEEEGSLIFLHPMVHRVVYDSIPLVKRKRMHMAFGRTLERLNATDLERVAFELAFHFNRAGPSDKAFRYTRLAGSKAEAMLAPYEAEGYFKDAVRSAEALRSNLNDDSVICAGEVLEVRHHLYQALVAQGKLEEALEASRISLSIARDVADAAREAQALMDMGEIGKIRSLWDDAKSTFEMARALCSDVGFQRGLFRAHLGLSWIAWRRGEFEIAFVHAKKCIEIGEELNDKHLVAQGYTELGTAYGERGDFEEAIENLSKAKAIFDAAGDKFMLSRTLNNLGVSYRDKGDSDGAITNFKRCIALSRKIGAIRMMAYGLSNLSECYLDKGELDRAQEACDSSLKMFIKLDEPYMVSSGYRRMGMIERMKNEYEEAHTYFLKSMALVGEDESPIHEAEIQFQFGILMKVQGENEKAKEHFMRSRVLFEKVGSKLGQERVDREMAKGDE